MPRQKMTELWVKHKKPLPGQRVDYFDTVTTGLALRINESGAKSWSVFYRVDGKQVRETIGRYPAKSLADARAATGERLELVERGRDPRKEKARQKAQEVRQRQETFGALADAYKKAKLAKLRSGDEQWAAVERDLTPEWGDVPLRGITRAMIMDRLDGIEADHGPYARNRRASLISAMFNFALDRQLVDSNPAARIEPLDETSRDRVLSDAELVEIWRAAEKLQQPLGPLVRLLILTGQRRSEISDLAWSEYDKAESLLTIPASRMKGKREHEVPLPPAAVALLESVPLYDPPHPYVFASPRRKDRPVNGFSQAKVELDRLILEARQEKNPKAEPMGHWVFHDLRRTMRSGLARLGISPDIAERVIAHVPGGVVGVYDRHQYREQKRAAIAVWCNHVAALIEPAPANVSDITKARAKRGKGGGNG